MPDSWETELPEEVLGFAHPPDMAMKAQHKAASILFHFIPVISHISCPLKRDYRRFKLKDMPHADDYASMKQVIERRFRRYLDGDEKFGDLPDVLLIDGGAGQVKAAQAAMAEVGISVPAFGMVKDGRHRTRALVDGEGREIGIQQNQAIFSLIGRIQEETHRFAIEFHRQQQASHLRRSALDDIPGVGPSRKAALLKHFKNVRSVRSASLDELMEAVPRNTALAVYRHFHSEGGGQPPAGPN